MYNLAKAFFIALVIFSAQYVTAQTWLESLTNPNPTFAETKAAAEAYFQQHPPKGNDKNYRLYKRWEWLNESRLLPDGSYPDADVNNVERTNYLKTHQQNNTFSGIGVFGLPAPTGNWVNMGPTDDLGDKYAGIGRVNCIAFHPTDTNTFWIGSPAGGIWKTTDGGKTWATTTDNTLPALGVSCIVIDPTNLNTMYIGSGDADGSDTKGVGVLKSTDGGLTWNKTGLSWTQSTGRKVRKLIINPQNPNTLIAATSVGIYKTTNAGTSWTVYSTSGNTYDVAYNPSDTSIVYASSASKIYRSTDGGASWTQITSITSSQRISLAVTPNNTALVEALVGSSATANPGGLLGIWRSTDSGFTYKQYFDGTPPNNLLGDNPDGSDVGGQAFYTLPFLINPNNYKEKWVGGVNTWHTTDDGVTWNASNVWSKGNYTTTVQEVHADKHFFAYSPLLTNTLFECNDGGLSKTSDSGITWTSLSKGLIISEIYRAGVAQTVSNKVVCGLQDNGSKEMNGSTWTELTGGDGTTGIIDYTNPAYKYTGYVNGVIYAYNTLKSPNPTTISDNIPLDSLEKNSSGGPNGAWLTPLVIDPQTPLTLYAGYKKIYKTLNRGKTWLAISPLLTTKTLYFMAVAPSNPGVIWASAHDSLFYTTNGGTTWNKLSKTAVDASIGTTNISGIAINSADYNEIWVTFSGYKSGKKVYKTTNGGTSWTNMSGTLPNLPVNCILCQKGAVDTCYLGTDIGVYYKDSSMADWVYFSKGLPNVVINDLAISYLDGKLWAGTYGRGLWNTDTYAKTLPVNIASITARKAGEHVAIDWHTANELKTSHFIIQHSTNGTSFTNIGTIKAIGSGANGYSFTDINPINGTNYYRLQSVDKNGSSSYSKVVSIFLNTNNLPLLTIAPNPARDHATISFSKTIDKATIEVYDITGKVVITQLTNGIDAFRLNTQNLANGVYVLKVNTDTGSYNQKLLISK